MLFTPFLIRSLGSAEYGVYSLVLAVSAFALLLDAGAGNAIVRFTAKYRANNDGQKQRNLLAVCLIYYSVAALLLVPICVALSSSFGFFFGEGLTQEQVDLGRKLLVVAFVEIGARLVSMPFSKLLIGIEEFAISKTIDIVRIVLRVVGSIVALAIGLGSEGVLIANCGASFVVLLSLAFIVLVKKNIRPTITGISVDFVFEIVRYTGSVFLLMLATQIIVSSDQVLIGALVEDSVEILAVYAVGALINQYFLQIANAVNGVLMPGIVRIVEGGGQSERLQNEMTTVGRLLFCILGFIWVTFLINGKSFVALWVGDQYGESAIVALVLMLPWGLALMENVGSSILYALGEHFIQAVMKLVVAVCNIAITVALIAWNPLIGAALGTAIAVFFGDVVVMNYVYKRAFCFRPLRYYADVGRGLLSSLIVSGLAGWVFSLVPLSGWVGFLANCTVMAGAFLVMLRTIGLNDEEQLTIHKLVHRNDRID